VQSRLHLNFRSLYNILVRAVTSAAAFGVQGFAVVLSDMCHSTHGNKMTDSYKSLDLARTAFEIATQAAAVPGAAPLDDARRGVLRPGGSLLMKILQGPGTQEFGQELREYFDKVAWHRPKATRSESKEVFLLGLKRK
jgi:23S rRNA (uridine2552-2'-O)-methyltransferase